MTDLEMEVWVAFIVFLGGSMLFAYAMSRRPRA